MYKCMEHGSNVQFQISDLKFLLLVRLLPPTPEGAYEQICLAQPDE